MMTSTLAGIWNGQRPAFVQFSNGLASKTSLSRNLRTVRHFGSSQMTRDPFLKSIKKLRDLCDNFTKLSEMQFNTELIRLMDKILPTARSETGQYTLAQLKLRNLQTMRSSIEHGRLWKGSWEANDSYTRHTQRFVNECLLFKNEKLNDSTRKSLEDLKKINFVSENLSENDVVKDLHKLYDILSKPHHEPFEAESKVTLVHDDELSSAAIAMCLRCKMTVDATFPTNVKLSLFDKDGRGVAQAVGEEPLKEGGDFFKYIT